MARPDVLYWPASNTTFIAPVQTATIQNTVAQLQTLAGAGNLTLNGSSVINGIANILGGPLPLSITSANDLHLRTFTIIGTNNGAVISETLTGPNVDTVFSVKSYSTVTSIAVNGAAAAVKVGAITPMILNGSQVTFPGISRAVSISSVNDESGTSFSVIGTLNGQVVSEFVVAGPNNGTVYTTQLFDTVTSVTFDLDITAVSVGSGLLGATHWALWNYHSSVLGFSVQVDVTAATMHYTFETTLDDVSNPSFVPTIATNVFTPIAAMTNATTSQYSTFNNVMRYYRVAIVAGVDATGSLQATFIQQGII